jgi:hypothetical protein
MTELPNKKRNDEVKAEINGLDKLDMGWQAEKHIGIAQNLSLLNVAESLQLLQLQLEETSKENRETISASVSSLSGIIKGYADTASKQALGSAWLSVALIFATVILALFTGFQGWEILGQRNDAQKVSSANLAFQFDQKLNQGIELQISDAIEASGTPILQPKGKFSQDQLEQWLGDYDTIGELYAEGLINDRIAYDLFSYDALLAYQNPEITNYLKTMRNGEHDQTLYDKFDYFAKVFLNRENFGTTKPLDQP